MSEFYVSVADVMGRPGAARPVRVRGSLEGAGTRLARLAPTEMSADLQAEAVVEGILVTGPVEASAEVDCARCLRSFRTGIEIEVCEMFAPGAGRDDEIYPVHGTDIDLEPMLRDALVLALPLNPVCRPDCKGICARCGQDLNEATCSCEDVVADPRWAALEELKEKLG